VTSDGYAKVADFGLARFEEHSKEVEFKTQTGVILGTVAYMSPEQASGKPLDARSDVFSFGVVLYEMLAARRPFTGSSTLEVLQAVVRDAGQTLA
jgi:serine/threonine protein kinase